MPAGVYARKPADVRFWTFVDKQGPWVPSLGSCCWVWTGASVGKGYGGFRAARWTYAHIFSYELHYGPVPHGMQINHRCNNRRCVRPDHLYAGTQSENLDDAFNSGTKPYGERHERAKLTDAQAWAVYKDPRSYRSIAAAYGVSAATVCLIKQGKSFRRVIQEMLAQDTQKGAAT